MESPAASAVNHGQAVIHAERWAESASPRACVLDPVVDRRWARLVERAPNAAVFHHPLWLRLLYERYRYPMSAVCLAGANGELLAGLPIATVQSRLTGTRLVSIPFSDVCGPVATDGRHVEELLLAVDDERRRLGLSLELHADVDRLPGGCPSERFIHHVVPLDGGTGTVLGKRVRSPKRRGAARARRLGVTTTQRIDGRAVEDFFRLHVGTRQRLGIPTQPRRFFRGLTELFNHGLGFVLLAEWEGRPIAGAIYLQHKSVLTYKYGAWSADQHDKHANDLLQLEALRIGCESGCSAVDLGRTEPENDGLRRFKRELGAEELELRYTTAPCRGKRKSVRSLSGLQRTVIRRTPAAVGRLVGAAVYRHVG